MKNVTKVALIAFALLAFCRDSKAQVEEFTETFNGTGPNSSFGILGFDNPGWLLPVDIDGIEFRDGGLFFPVEGDDDPPPRDIVRNVEGIGSFSERVVLKELRKERRGSMSFGLGHFFDLDNGGRGGFSVHFVREEDSDFVFFETDNEQTVLGTVAIGDSFSMGLDFDLETSEFLVAFDNDTADEMAEERFGPFAYRQAITDSQQSALITAAILDRGSIVIDNWSLTRQDATLLGDFNMDGSLTVEDLSLLDEEIRIGGNGQVFDVIPDGIVDRFDRSFWITDLVGTWFGDSNFDGEFNSSDLVLVFGFSEYEDEIDLNSTWSEGDWNGDGDFNSRDLVFAFQDGGYEVGPRRAVSFVPEPSNPVILLLVVGAFGVTNRSRQAPS